MIAFLAAAAITTLTCQLDSEMGTNKGIVYSLNETTGTAGYNTASGRVGQEPANFTPFLVVIGRPDFQTIISRKTLEYEVGAMIGGSWVVAGKGQCEIAPDLGVKF